jgi:hypothetical protein
LIEQIGGGGCCRFDGVEIRLYELPAIRLKEALAASGATAAS